MRCFSRWALACGFCTLLIMLSGWTALGARSPLAAPPASEAPKAAPEAEALNSREKAESAILAASDSSESDTLIPSGAPQWTPLTDTRQFGRAPIDPEDPAVGVLGTLRGGPDTLILSKTGPLATAHSSEPDTLISPSSASSSQLQGEFEASPSSTNLADERTLQDIMELRREQGGLFRGTLLEELGAPGGEEEFLQALRTAASSHQHPPMPAQWGTSACEATYTRQIQRELGTDGGDGELVQTLRLAGRQLDVKAADLEDAGQYEAADGLRKLARRLRRQARELKPSPPLHPLKQARR